MPTPVGKGVRVMSQEQIDRMYAHEQEVMDLRVSGMSFYRIDKKLGIRNSHQVFQRAMARNENINMRREEALRLEEARLNRMQEGIWGRVMTGDPRAVEVALKVLERRARLLGLDFADLISGKLLEVEQAKVMLVAETLTETLKARNVPQAERDAMLADFFARIKAAGQRVDEALAAQQTPPAPIIGRVVARDQDLL